MGFDNECILTIQSLAGEYFCPVCRLLVYPNEAIQSQCTHLYCKPCLTYIVGTTRACPYDGYLVTEADSKPLIESNKALAETIGKIDVHCLYHRSGCTWQGQLSECTTHCAGCAFGDSPVVCNRCGTQIVHRQVQEHAQNCLGVQPQSQQAESGQDATAATGTTVAAEQNQAATTQTGTQTSQPQPTQVAAAPLSAPNQSQTNTISQPQAVPPQAVVPTPEQWYQQQQQYQQYYQQYLGYDPYQQQYQQYDMYQQQQVHQQYQQQIHPPHVVQGHHQPQMYMQPQPQSQPQPQPQPQPPVQAPALSQPQPQPQASTGPQPQVQAPVNPQHQIQPTAQPHSQMPPQNYPPSQGHQHHQLYPQPQPQPHPPQLQAQPHLQQRPQVPHQHQQPHPQVQQPHPQPQPQPQPQPRPLSQPQLHPQTQLQHHPHMQPQPQPQPQPQLQGQHPSAHAVTGHQSYPLAQPPQQALPGAPQQHPMNMYPQQQSAPHQPPPQHIVQAQGQFPQQQQPPQMRPPPSHVIMQHQQQPPILPPQQQPVHPHVHQQGQPIPQHPPMHPLQQPVHQQQVHGHLQQHPQSFPGQTPGLVHSQPHQPGHFMQQPQQVVQTQLRPQGPPISLQQHQSQNHVVRPMMQSHGVPHHQPFQPSGGPPHGKPMQPSALQPSLNQTIPSKTNIRPQSSPGQQLGHSGTVLFPALAAPQSGTKTQVSSVQANIKVELEADVASQKTDAKEASGSDSVDLKIPKSEIDLKSVGGEEKSVNEDGSKNNQSNIDVKEISESSQAIERETASLVHENDSEEPVIKKETVTVVSEPLTAEIATKDTEQDGNSLQADKEIQDGVIKKNSPSQQTEVLEGKDAKMQKDAVMPFPGVDKGSLGVPQSFDSGPDRTGQNVIPQSQIPRQNIVPTHEKMLPQPGYQERNLPQPPFPRQGPVQMQGSSFVQSGNVAAAPDNNQHLPLYYGQPPPHMQDRAHQRPPVPDQMMHPSMPPPHQMQVPGQLPVHMRPQQQHILPGNLPPQGQPSVPPEHLRPPILNRPHSSFLPEVPPGGSFGRGPGPLRPPPPQGGFELQPTVPQGHHFQAHAPFVHGAGPRIQGDPGSGPPPGAFDSQAGMMPRGPPHGSEGIIGQSRPTNPMDDEMFANKRPGYFDGRQPDSFGQSSLQSNIIKMNGGPGKGLTGGVQDPSFPFGSQEERFKPLPEERYKQFPEEGFNPLAEERFKPFPVEPSRRLVDHREFEEDLKKFPRPGHLDSEHVGKFESYYSSSRPFDRVPPGFSHEVGPKLDGSASGAASRYLPPYQPGGLRPVGPLDDNMRRKTDSIGVHPDFLRNASEPGRHRMDGLPPLRSPGREYHSSRFGPPEDIDVRESHVFGERGVPFKLSSDGNAFHESRFPTLPSHLRRSELDGPGNLRMGEKIGSGALPVHFRSGEPHNLPGHLRMGEPAGFGAFPNHLRAGEVGGPRNLPSNLRIGDSLGGKLHGPVRMGEPEFNSSFPIHGYPNDSGFFNAGDVESFDQPRKRKSGTMGWCRICKVDCETVEGLDMHSQTREHQKMAMDMVLSIKKDNAKKQKLSSDDHVSHEDANKSRKASFESHGN